MSTRSYKKPDPCVTSTTKPGSAEGTENVRVGQALTVLYSSDRRPASKTHRYLHGEWSTESYRGGKFWFTAELPVHSVGDLEAAIRRLAAIPHALVIRGGLREDVRQTPGPYLRRVHGELAAFEATPRQWVCLDFDGVDFPGEPGHDTYAAFKATLPEPWRSAACVWQASASAGLPGKEGVRVHLWYWLDRALSDAELTRWFASEKLGEYHVDVTLFRAVQPHFTANPLFMGAPDPMPERVGALEGVPEVATPPDAVLKLLPTPTQFKAAERALKAECKALAATEEGGRGKRAFVAAYGLGKHSCLPDSQIFNALLDACRTAGLDAQEAYGHINNGIARGRAERTQAVNEPWRAALKYNEEGEIVSTLTNFLKILRDHPAFEGALSWQERTQQALVVKELPWRKEGPLSDGDDVKMREWFEETLGVKVPKQEAWDLLLTTARNNPSDPFRDWLLALEWDGIPRLDTLPDLFEVVRTPYASATFTWWMISAVARTLRPGCQVDHMIVLSGRQGYYKSTAFIELVPFHGCYATLSARGSDLFDKDNVAKVHGPVIVGIDEMAAFKGREADTVKHFITERSDRYRPPYGRSTVDFARSNIFCGTTNEVDYLTDTTGGRRFWPHEVVRPIDVSKIVAVRDHLWAEALHRYQAGERWWPTPEETNRLAITKIQDSKRAPTPLEDAIIEAICTPGRPAEFTTGQLGHWTGQDMNRHNRALGAIMASLGYEKDNAARPRVWKKK